MITHFVAAEGLMPPGDSYAAVRYRGTWYWIDDDDIASKRIVSFLLIFFSLAEAASRRRRQC